MYHTLSLFILKEVKRGRVAGPYTTDKIEQFIGSPIRSSPVAMVPKPTIELEKKWCVVEDNSFPYDPLHDGTTSINFLLDSDDFPCNRTKNAELCIRFATYDKEAEVMIVDLEEAFHHLSNEPLVRPHLCITHGIEPRNVSIRKNASLGLCSTPGTFGNLVNASLAIMANKLPFCEAVNQVDNFTISRLRKNVFSSDQPISLLKDLGWEVHPFKTKENPNGKGLDFSHIFTFNGCIFNINNFTISIPEEKHLKYCLTILNFLFLNKISLRQYEQIVGYLSYIASIIRRLKTHLRRIYTFRKGFDTTWTKLKLTRGPREDLDFWTNFLSTPHIFEPFSQPTTPSTLICYSGASNWGLGITINNFAAQWYLLEDWRFNTQRHHRLR